MLRDSVWDRDDVLCKMLENTRIPRFMDLKQSFDRKKVENLEEELERGFLGIEDVFSSLEGKTVAVTAGSRGVANIAKIIRSIVSRLRKSGALPFIVPAMGSHGGATAEGQKELLAALGITEDSTGAPIHSSMDVIRLGTSKSGETVFIDKLASAADGIVVVGRVKPHTCFRGAYESGLMKMMTIGLGKQRGAEVAHRNGFGYMARNVEECGSLVLEKAPVLFGVATVENAYEETAIVSVLRKEEIKRKEPLLLEKAKRFMPSLPFDSFDILIVDQIGKNFSGDGMDPNVTGLYMTPYASGGPSFQRCVVLDVCDESHGNSNGIGTADFSTKRLFDKTDFDSGYVNALTSTVVAGVKMPMILRNDEHAVKAAIFSCNDIDKETVRIVRIANSLHIQHLSVSESLLEEAREKERVQILSDLYKLPFNASGNLF